MNLRNFIRLSLSTDTALPDTAGSSFVINQSQRQNQKQNPLRFAALSEDSRACGGGGVLPEKAGAGTPVVSYTACPAADASVPRTVAWLSQTFADLAEIDSEIARLREILDEKTPGAASPHARFAWGGGWGHE